MGEGSCGCISVYVDDVLEELEEVILTSSVPDTCGECGVTIPPGEEYEFFVGRDSEDGSITDFVTCMDCRSIRNEFFCEGWFYGRILDDVNTHVYDLGGEISSECLARLTPGGRDIILSYIDDVFEEINE